MQKLQNNPNSYIKVQHRKFRQRVSLFVFYAHRYVSVQDGQTDGRTDGLTDGHTHRDRQTNRQTP